MKLGNSHVTSQNSLVRLAGDTLEHEKGTLLLALRTLSLTYLEMHHFPYQVVVVEHWKHCGVKVVLGNDLTKLEATIGST